MKIRSRILVVSLILAVVCFVGCKRKTEPAKTDATPAKPNIVQPVKVDSNTIEPNNTAKVEARQIVATVNGVQIFKDDFDKE